MTVFRSIKNLAPISLRRLLKEQLPARLVRAVATTPVPQKKSGTSLAKERYVPARPQCPICGMSLPAGPQQKAGVCSGCGSKPHQRRLALAVYANVDGSSDKVLVLGSGVVRKFLSETMEHVTFAETIAQVPSELQGVIDCCVHAHGFNRGPSAHEALRRADALLTADGRQFFALDSSPATWRPARWRSRGRRFTDWLQQNGWSTYSTFEPVEYYGDGATEIFGCASDGEAEDMVIVLARARDMNHG